MAYPAIRVKMGFDGEDLYDTYEKWGFIYIESDNRTAPPEKKRETSTYPEQEGENVDPRTVDDVFDYKIKFLIECPNSNKENANIKIKAFNDAIRTKDATGVKYCKTIVLHNTYKRVKIVGIPEIIEQPTEFYRDRNGTVMDCVLFEMVIHVDKPSRCDFSLAT